jgi:hypothetical protein
MPWLPPLMGHVAIGGQQQQARMRAIAIGALEAIAQDRELLHLSAELARQTAAGTVSPEEAARQLSQDSPEVASLFDRAPAALRTALIRVLLTAIPIIAAQALAELRDHSASPADVERIVRQYEREHDRDMQREIQDAVERALGEYESQHPPAAEPPRATPQKPDRGSDQRPDR